MIFATVLFIFVMLYGFGIISFRGGFFRGLRRFLSGDFCKNNKS